MLASESQNADTVRSYMDFSGLAQLKNKSSQHNSQQLKAVAQQFESIFMNMMLKSMRDANKVFNQDNIFDSQQGDVYQDLFDHQISVDSAKSHSLGLADMIVKQLTKKPL